MIICMYALRCKLQTSKAKKSIADVVYKDFKNYGVDDSRASESLSHSQICARQFFVLLRAIRCKLNVN